MRFDIKRLGDTEQGNRKTKKLDKENQMTIEEGNQKLPNKEKKKTLGVEGQLAPQPP